MEWWWIAIAAVGTLACCAVSLRSTSLSFLALAAFMPLALYTLHHDFESFWVILVLSFAVELMALARCSQLWLGADEDVGVAELSGRREALTGAIA